MSPYRHALMPMTNFGIAKNTKTKYVEKAKICCNETQHKKPKGMINNKPPASCTHLCYTIAKNKPKTKKIK